MIDVLFEEQHFGKLSEIDSDNNVITGNEHKFIAMHKMTLPRSVLYTILGTIGLILTFQEIQFNDAADIIKLFICGALFILGVSYMVKYVIRQ